MKVSLKDIKPSICERSGSSTKKVIAGDSVVDGGSLSLQYFRYKLYANKAFGIMKRWRIEAQVY